MLLTSGPFFLPSFNKATSIEDKFSSNRILEQFPKSLPSQVSFFFATHSLFRRCDRTFVVQHLLLSHIFILMSSSEPTFPMLTSTFLKTMLEAPETQATQRPKTMRLERVMMARLSPAASQEDRLARTNQSTSVTSFYHRFIQLAISRAA